MAELPVRALSAIRDATGGNPDPDVARRNGQGLSRRALLALTLLSGCGAAVRSAPRRTEGHADGRPAGTAPAATRPATAGRSPSVALTFHGAGDPALARQLLGEAERAHVHVTVLAVGSWLDSEPDMARRILDGGHELGNHTYTHPVLPRLDEHATVEEIVRCREVLRRLTGSPGRWFRPSGTPRATPLIRACAARAGYPTCLGYDVDPADYTDPGPDAVVTRTLSAARRGSVVSLHLGHPGTVAALPRLLAGLEARGLQAGTASAVLAR